MLEFIIIGMVLDEALTGYDMKKSIEKGIGVFYKASYGSLYPALKKLTNKGFLSLTEGAQGGRVKKYYQATEQGKEGFFNWLTSPLNFTDDSENRLVKVYFFDRLPKDMREKLLKEYEMKNQNYLHKLMELESHFSKLENKECFYYKLSTLYYGIRVIQVNINWCRHLLENKPLGEFVEELR